MRLALWMVVTVVVMGCVKNERDYQLEHARSLTPKELGKSDGPSDLATPVAPQPPRVLTVRAWVDLDYQSQVLHWNDRITAQLAQASRLTKSALNVELKLVSIEAWDRRTGLAPLEGQLRELERQDVGKDVDLVLGFVSSLQVFSQSQHELGMARVLGRHAVVRAMDNAGETDAIRRVFTRLDEAEKDKLYRERKLHKEVAVLLHEWAHTLGAPHDTAMDSLENPVYEVHRTRFRPMTLTLLARTLELRDKKTERKEQARQLAAFVREAPEGTWRLQDLQSTLEDFDGITKGEEAREVTLSNQRDRATYDEVLRLSKKGQHVEALTALQPLLAKEPPVTAVHALGCQLAGMADLHSAETLARCEAAVIVAPGDGGAWFMLAQAQAAKGQLEAARTSFVRARTQLLANKQPSMETHAGLASVARRLMFVSWAEESSGRALGRAVADETNEWAMKKRRWLGLPAGVEAPAASDEPAYADRFMKAQDELSANQLPKAETTIAALEKDFPTLPGPMTLRCELFLRRSANAKAIAACEKALTSYPDSLQANYLLGIVYSMTGNAKKTVVYLEPVVATDVTVDDAWQRLASAYGQLGDRANRERVQKRQPK